MTGDLGGRRVPVTFAIRRGEPSGAELAAVTAVLLALARASAPGTTHRAPGTRVPRWPAEKRSHVPAGAWAAAPRGAAGPAA